MIHVISYNEKSMKGCICIDTTSHSHGWTQWLSPFFVGPCPLYDGHVAERMENGWQYSKVYPEHVDANREPTQAYWDWAKDGWRSLYSRRYPMGKGAVPLYSIWARRKLGYLDARMQIYIPLYVQAVQLHGSYGQLLCLAQEEASKDRGIYIKCFDSYNYRAMGMTLHDVMICTERPMGHAFILAAMLEEALG